MHAKATGATTHYRSCGTFLYALPWSHDYSFARDIAARFDHLSVADMHRHGVSKRVTADNPDAIQRRDLCTQQVGFGCKSSQYERQRIAFRSTAKLRRDDDSTASG
jgi:hypothetical protein